MPASEEMYAALCAGDSAYEGVFVFAVRTTGVFCRPSCSARTPRPENVEFFADAASAVAAGYRACLKCRPLELAGAAPGWLAPLLDELEADPRRRWRDADLRALGLEPARVRRWFQAHHGVTFHGYQRGRRLGSAFDGLQRGSAATGAGVAVGFESESGFREAFGRLFGAPPAAARGAVRVTVDRMPTPLGPMLAAATDTALVLLEFHDRKAIERQVAGLGRALGAVFTPGENAILAATRRALTGYFEGWVREFGVPFELHGTPFQRAVWQQLGEIPYGETRSYAEVAAAIGRPKAVRAVGRANGQNRLAVVVPCHRVVAADGQLTGYGGLVWRKRALLELERRRGRAARARDAASLE